VSVKRDARISFVIKDDRFWLRLCAAGRQRGQATAVP
jgi:hypothetical protein